MQPQSLTSTLFFLAIFVVSTSATLCPATKTPICNLRPTRAFQTFCGFPNGRLAKPQVLEGYSPCVSSTYESCVERCITTDGCVSIQYSSSTRQCTMLAAKIEKQGFVHTPADQDKSFYNKACFTYKSGTDKCPTTPVSPPPLPKQPCGDVLAYNSFEDEYTYSRTFMGKGRTENADNPGATDSEGDKIVPVTSLLDGVKAGQDCLAIQQCAVKAAEQDFLSFDVHWLTSERKWQCVAYFGGNDDASYFDVENADVGRVYGYSVSAER